jgi:hypothetical protein
LPILQLLGFKIGALGDAICFDVVSIQSEPVKRRNSTWQSFQLVRENSGAILVVATRWMHPDHIVFTVSRDWKRMVRPSTWSTDSRLVSELDQSLLDAGGCYLGDGKG